MRGWVGAALGLVLGVGGVWGAKPVRHLQRAPGPARLVVGNPGEVQTPVSGGTALVGGGSDRASEAAFRYLVAQSGGGDFVVLRGSGTDAYNPFVWALGGVDSVETLIVDAREEASDPHVVVRVQNAEAIFLAGGDQADYLTFWDDTPLETAVDAAVARGVPVGGTSAGLAVLGQVDFAALHGSVTSGEALANPYDRRVTLERGFLQAPGLAATITDSHFVARDRMGRLVAFLARMVQDGWASEARGIGIDEDAALIVEPGGAVRLAGRGAAYLLRTPGPPERCTSGQPLRFSGVEVYKLAGAATFDLTSWQGNGGASYTVSAADGRLSSTAPGGAVY